MKNFEQELEQIKTNLLKNFIDPTPNNSLKNFIVKGKFIRSSLAVLYLKSHNCAITEDIYKILEVGETIHSASLLHDDVIDNAKTRRNETVIAEQFSSKVSILAGDLLIAKSIKKLLELNNNEIIEIFRDCTEKMSISEIKQFFLRGKLISEEDYISICEGKTANLFAAILKSCAAISNISKVTLASNELIWMLVNILVKYATLLDIVVAATVTAASDAKSLVLIAAIHTIKIITGYIEFINILPIISIILFFEINFL